MLRGRREGRGYEQLDKVDKVREGEGKASNCVEI